MSSSIPSGAASLVMTGNTENGKDLTSDVYYAAGQLEFSSIPQNGSTISITDAGTGKTYTFEFVKDAAHYAGANIPVEISNQVVSVDDFVKNFETALKENMPSAERFTADGNKISIVQSTMGSALTIDASKTLSCLQSAVNPRADTGIPTGVLIFRRLTMISKTVPALTLIPPQRRTMKAKPLPSTAKLILSPQRRIRMIRWMLTFLKPSAA